MARPALLGQLHSCGLAFTSAGLFACGLALKEQGWDMQHRIAQLQNNPADVDTLRAWLPAPRPAELDEPAAQALAAPEHAEEVAPDEAFYPWPDDGRDERFCPPDRRETHGLERVEVVIRTRRARGWRPLDADSRRASPPSGSA